MYCEMCGSAINESAKHCYNCGAPITVRTGSVLTAKEEEVPKRSWGERFRDEWRDFARSPLVLAMIICFSAVQLINLMSAESTMNAIYAALDILGSDASVLYGPLSSTLETLQFVIVLPGILMAVGLWLVYIDGYNSSLGTPIKTGGLSIIQGIQIANIGAMVFFVVAVFSALDTIRIELGSRLPDELEQTFGTVKMVAFIVAAIGSVIYGVYLNAVSKIKKTVVDCEPDGQDVVYGAGVLSIIGGIISVISLFVSGITLVGALSCASSVLMGVVLCKCGRTMEDLAAIQKNKFRKGSGTSSLTNGMAGGDGAGRKPKQVEENIPTWKRIQMEETAAKQVQMPQNETEVQKPSVPAKKCPECGTTQSGDNSVCFYCGAEF